jgi:hypothetical protein
LVHESDAPLTVPEDLQLATDSRAVERADFDAHMTAKMQQEEVSCSATQLQRLRVLRHHLPTSQLTRMAVDKDTWHSM